MLRSLPFALLALTLSVHAADKSTTLDATIDHISVAVPATIIITRGDSPHLVIDASDADLSRLEVEVKGHEVSVGVRRKGWFSDDELDSDVTLRFELAELSKLELAGSGDVSIAPFSGKKLALEVAGSGDVTAESLTYERIEAEVAGSGEIAVKGGQCDSLSIDIAGSGEVNAADLACQDVALDVAGSGDAEVNASKTLDVSIAGSGSVKYKGTPQIDQSIQGSGDINHF